MICRNCQTKLEYEFIDLVNAPASNSYLSSEQLNNTEPYYPLKLYVCHKCFLVQLDELKKSEEIFSEDYAYFSSYSSSWVSHARSYVDMICERLQLNHQSKVMEIASNDGYLLQFFQSKGIRCFGVEPTACTAKVAEEKGIECIRDFFTTESAKSIKQQKGAHEQKRCWQ